MTGGTPSPHHVLLFRLVLESRLTNAAASVLPPLLALFGLDPARVWHVAGALAFTVMLAHFVSYPYRRRYAAPDQPMGALGWGNIALLFCGPALLVPDVAEVWVYRQVRSMRSRPTYVYSGAIACSSPILRSSSARNRRQAGRLPAFNRRNRRSKVILAPPASGFSPLAKWPRALPRRYLVHRVS